MPFSPTADADLPDQNAHRKAQRLLDEIDQFRVDFPTPEARATINVTEDEWGRTEAAYRQLHDSHETALAAGRARVAADRGVQKAQAVFAEGLARIGVLPN